MKTRFGCHQQKLCYSVNFCILDDSRRTRYLIEMKCAILLALFVCAAVAAPTEEDALQQLALGNRQFAAAVYKELLKTNKGNIIFSPFSAETVLALASEGAKGATRDELITGLSLPAKQESVQKSFKEFLPKLTSNTEDLKLLSANRIYANTDVKLEDTFKTTAVDIFKSGVEKVDFSKNEEAAHTINTWVEDQTNKKIKDLIQKDDIGSDTALVLVNAIYLSAKWVHKFDDFTRNGKFYKSAKEEIEVPMMTQLSSLKYYDNTELGVQFLELPYIGEDLSMVIALPHEKEGLTALEGQVDKLLEPQPLKYERVDVKLPRFLIETEIQFVDILQALGVKKIFNPKEADLTGLSSTHKNLYVSKVIQKAFINVTETGTEAAAATAAIFTLESAFIPGPVSPPPKIFYANHPFSFYIKKAEFILFTGLVNFN